MERRSCLLAAGLFLFFTARLDAGEICGGITGTPCPNAGEFCSLPDGECCCDFQGMCMEIPQACPAIYEPVCGCDGVTYTNRCEATRNSVSVARNCPCEQPLRPGSFVELTDFSASHRLFWSPVPEALGYNVYIDDDGFAPFGGRCLYAAVPEPSVLLQGKPEAHESWMFQISALHPGGEGPIGSANACDAQAPAAPCTCTLPADAGPCDGACPRWFFTAATGQCEEFIWGCCGGNANNFETAAACAAACVDPCTFPAAQGHCDALVPRWFYNVLTGHCEEFIWGGCGGNANNFATVEACRSQCGDTCLLPVDPGPCDGSCPRWFFNAATGQCEEFIWGCCGGNANNFESQAACEAECPSP